MPNITIRHKYALFCKTGQVKKSCDEFEILASVFYFCEKVLLRKTCVSLNESCAQQILKSCSLSSLMRLEALFTHVYIYKKNI